MTIPIGRKYCICDVIILFMIRIPVVGWGIFFFKDQNNSIILLYSNFDFIIKNEGIHGFSNSIFFLSSDAFVVLNDAFVVLNDAFVIFVICRSCHLNDTFVILVVRTTCLSF